MSVDENGPGRRRADASDTVPRGMQIAVAWSWRLVLVAVAVYLAVRVLGHFVVVVAPVLIAVLLVALVLPVVQGLVRLRVPRWLAALVTVVAVVAVVAGLATLVGTAVANGFPQLQREAGAGLQEVREALAGPPLRLTTGQLVASFDQVRQGLLGNRSNLVNGALAATTTATHVVAGVFLVLFSTYFFLAQGEAIWGFVLRLLPDAAGPRLDVAARAGWSTLTSFVRATVLVALTDAMGVGVGAAIIAVPLAFPLAVLVFLGAFVPVVGALVSGSVAVLVALVAGGPVKALVMLAILVGVQQLESHVLQPFLLGRAVSVHPLAVILGIATGAVAAGVIGALFAVPLIAFGNTVAQALGSPPDEQPERGQPEPPVRRAVDGADAAPG